MQYAYAFKLYTSSIYVYECVYLEPSELMSIVKMMYVQHSSSFSTYTIHALCIYKRKIWICCGRIQVHFIFFVYYTNFREKRKS